MTSLRTVAEAYALGVCAGVVAWDEIIAWVDAAILDQEQPPYPLLAASTARDPNALLAALREFPGELDPAEVRARLFAQMLRALRADRSMVKAITRTLLWMAIENDVPDEDARQTMYWLDDAFDLAAQGISGDLETVRADIHAFLETHARGDAA